MDEITPDLIASGDPHLQRTAAAEGARALQSRSPASSSLPTRPHSESHLGRFPCRCSSWPTPRFHRRPDADERRLASTVTAAPACYEVKPRRPAVEPARLPPTASSAAVRVRRAGPATALRSRRRGLRLIGRRWRADRQQKTDTSEHARPFDVPAIREDFPVLRPERAWKAAGVAGQRRHDAKASKRDRRDFALLRARLLEHPSRSAHAGRPGDRRLRESPRQSADLSGSFVSRRKSSSSAARPKASTWSRRPTDGSSCNPATKSCCRRSNITPTSSPGKWSPRRKGPCYG